MRGFFGEYRWLSNFWPCPIPTLDGVYPSVEHAYQAYKSRDPEVRRRVMALPMARDAKRASKSLAIRGDWASIKLNVGLFLVRIKFTQNPHLRTKLLSTGDEELVEENYWGDRFWGQTRGVGQNHLGRILMKVRHEFRSPPQVLNMKRVAFDPRLHVYIGRGKNQCHMMNTEVGERGWLGNPVAVGKPCPVCGREHERGGFTLPCYRVLLKRRWEDPRFVSALAAPLIWSKPNQNGDKSLVCWCSPEPCHGYILARAIRSARKAQG